MVNTVALRYPWLVESLDVGEPLTFGGPTINYMWINPRSVQWSAVCPCGHFVGCMVLVGN